MNEILQDRRRHSWNQFRKQLKIFIAVNGVGFALLLFLLKKLIPSALDRGWFVPVVGAVVGMMAARLSFASTAVQSNQLLRLLKGFYWFCGRENREHIELTIGDLRKDLYEMQTRGHGPGFINLVLVWQTLIGTIVPILCDGLLRFVGAVMPLAKSLRR